MPYDTLSWVLKPSLRTFQYDAVPHVTTLQLSIIAFFLAASTFALHMGLKVWFDKVMNCILSTYYRIPTTIGGNLPGPAYSFPNGQMVEKVLFAKLKSWEWNEKYGKTYLIWAGSIPEVVFTDPKDLKILYEKSMDHDKTSLSNAGWLFTQLLGSGLGLINRTRWRTARKKMDPMFSHRMALQYLRDSVNTDAAMYAADILRSANLEKVEMGTKGEFIVNATEALQRFPFFEVAVMFYGRMSGEEKTRLWELGRLFSQAFTSVVAGGIHRSKLTKYANTIGWKNARKYQTEWERFNKDIYHDRKVRAPETSIVMLMDAADRGEITHAEVYDTIAESTFANLDIVTHVISSSVILLADDQKVQTDLLAERQNNANQVEYIGRKDTLLHYCLLESIRLRPVLTFSLPETSPRNKSLETFILPKNTAFIVDSFAINIRNPFWGPDNRSYRPNRFKDINKHDLQYNLALFGYGGRKCLGQHVADKVIKSMIYHLFKRYQIFLQPMRAADGEFDTDKTSWVGLYNVDLRLVPREEVASDKGLHYMT